MLFFYLFIYIQKSSYPDLKSRNIEVKMKSPHNMKSAFSNWVNLSQNDSEAPDRQKENKKEKPIFEPQAHSSEGLISLTYPELHQIIKSEIDKRLIPLTRRIEDLENQHKQKQNGFNKYELSDHDNFDEEDRNANYFKSKRPISLNEIQLANRNERSDQEYQDLPFSIGGPNHLTQK
jgi:hypothetical protein